MRCLVVGGAGFVGSHVVDRLLAEGHTVDVVDDLSTGSSRTSPPLAPSMSVRLKFHNVDVRQPELADLLGRLRPRWRRTSRSRRRARGPVSCRRRSGTANLLDAAMVAGTTKVVVGLDAVALRRGAAP